jgi:hypothetical protein
MLEGSEVTYESIVDRRSTSNMIHHRNDSKPKDEGSELSQGND